MGCPRGWQKAQKGWCIDPETGNGFTAAEAKQMYRDRNGGAAPWGSSLIGGITDTLEILFGDGNTNDTVVVQQGGNGGNNDNTMIWVGVGVVVLVIIMLFIFLRK